ncbi:MAG: hypothetical protein AAB966_04695 [Patescibacteria group bacterium]
MAKRKSSSRAKKYDPQKSPIIQVGVVVILVSALFIMASLAKRFPNLFF